MRIQQFPCGPIEANSYLIETETSFVIIDPSVPLSVFPELNKPVSAIVITHCHYDHVACLEEIREATKAEVYCHSLEFPSFSDIIKNASAFFMMDKKYPLPDHQAADMEILRIDENTTLQFIHTPGHTMGSMCVLLAEDGKNIALFTGDTLFQGSAGRTDLGGSPVLLAASLKRLKQYDNEVLVYSGHGDNSTIGEEKRINPFMQNRG